MSINQVLLILLLNSFSILTMEQQDIIKKYNKANDPVNFIIPMRHLKKLIASYLSSEWNLAYRIEFNKLSDNPKQNVDKLLFNGEFLVCIYSDLELGTNTKTVTILDLSNNEFTKDSYNFYVVQLSKDNKLAMALGNDINILDLENKDNKYFHAKTKNDFIQVMEFSENSKYLATGSYNGILKVYNMLDGTETFIGQSNKFIQALAFSSDEKYIACASPEYVNILSNSNNKNLCNSLKIDKTVNGPIKLQFSFDNKILTILSNRNKEKIYNLNLDTNSTDFINNSNIKDFAYSADRNCLSYIENGDIVSFNISDWQKLERKRVVKPSDLSNWNQEDTCFFVKFHFSQDGQFLTVLNGETGIIRIYQNAMSSIDSEGVRQRRMSNKQERLERIQRKSLCIIS